MENIGGKSTKSSIIKKSPRTNIKSVSQSLNMIHIVGPPFPEINYRVYSYRVYHAKLDIRKRWHSASKSAKIVLKKDSKSKFSLIWDQSGICRSSRLKMRAIKKKKLSESKSCPKSFSSKCSVHFKLMLWLEYLTQTHEIFTQKTGAHVLFESFFRTIFAPLEAECHRFLIWHDTPCTCSNNNLMTIFSNTSYPGTAFFFYKTPAVNVSVPSLPTFPLLPILSIPLS